MISIQQLTFQYNAHSHPIHFPDWQVAQGEHALILGSSGSGKTTLLHLLAGLLKPSQGKIKVGEENLDRLQKTNLDKYRGRNIGLVFQKPHLLNSLSLEQNLLLAQYMAGLKQDRQRVNSVIETLGLAHRKKALVHTLSQGEAQRASIARSVLNTPKVILADEPTSSLDDENCEKVLSILREQAQAYQATLVIATHDKRVKDIINKHYIMR
ncbi:putative ABC transport system ATP-binding protein [Catalinimonas alkaloidigena]|uniref:ABC transporter ATP-binding protein n=1 Tax=Catalinimonas alkaloidigena TaxID=1075417 RepID=UPI0024064BB0|nr:ATP-binding cassette domain-containing protein [Catalinimonas alkaloidigena]MDF9798474.1 putative ABC transport system ATP-binding protein [Catalinimonas alkaloidigena]